MEILHEVEDSVVGNVAVVVPPVASRRGATAWGNREREEERLVGQVNKGFHFLCSVMSAHVHVHVHDCPSSQGWSSNKCLVLIVLVV